MNDRCRQCGWPWDINAAGLCKNCQELKASPDPLSKHKNLGGVEFKDMKHLDEEKRFLEIASLLRDNPGKVIGVMVDCGEGYSDKGDRYIRAIRALVPEVKIVDRRPGPIKGVEVVRFRI